MQVNTELHRHEALGVRRAQLDCAEAVLEGAAWLADFWCVLQLLKHLQSSTCIVFDVLYTSPQPGSCHLKNTYNVFHALNLLAHD